MTIWIIIALIAYLIIGGIAFLLVSQMEGYNHRRWVPTFVLTAFLWPLILLVWGVAAIVEVTG